MSVRSDSQNHGFGRKIEQHDTLACNWLYTEFGEYT